MEIGLLLCDEVPDDLLNIDGTYQDMFQKLLPDAKIIPYPVFEDQFPESVLVHDNWIISGSRYSVYDDVDWIKKLKSFTKQMSASPSKCIGVCFGHQLIAEALGGQVQKAASGWEIGVKTFELKSEVYISEFGLRNFNILMMCQDQVRKLPENAKVLASSETCPVGMYRIGDQFLSIQGHPEYTKAYDKALIEKRKHRYEPNTYTDALASLSRSVDWSLFQDIIFQFLKYNSSNPH